MNNIFSRVRAERALALGLICAIFLSVARFEAKCEDLRHNVLRLHIIANSDSAPDQAVKLKVRDRILEKAGYLFEDETRLISAEKTAQKNLELFNGLADEILRENGFDYTAKTEVKDSFFETREYEDFTLPAGNYRALTVTLGDGEGKNWWCVCFPAVCIPSAEGKRLSDSTGDASAEMAEHPKRYVMAFKTVEIYEKIKNFIFNK